MQCIMKQRTVMRTQTLYFSYTRDALRRTHGLYFHEVVRSFKMCIVGGGLAGMAAAYYAVKMIPNVSITVYDNESGPGLGGASSAPVTLLHPYTPKGKVIWRGYEGFQSVLDVMNDVNYDASDMRIYRPFFDSKRFHKYRCRVEPSAQVEILNRDAWVKHFPNSHPQDQNLCGGVLLTCSRIIETPLYLRAVWKYISSHSCETKWIQKNVRSIRECQYDLQYDAIIVSCGVDSPAVWYAQHHSAPMAELPFKYVIGSTIILPDPVSASSDGVKKFGLNNAVISGEYVIPHPSKSGYLLCGATKENVIQPEQTAWSKCNPNALDELIPKLVRLYPPLGKIDISSSLKENIWRGVKIYANRSGCMGQPRLPLVTRHPVVSNCWLVTGFGSRGLIHHSTVAKSVIAAIRNDNLAKIPLELRQL